MDFTFHCNGKDVEMQKVKRRASDSVSRNRTSGIRSGEQLSGGTYFAL